MKGNKIMQNNEKITAVYCRVACADADNWAIEHQKQAMLEYAQKQGFDNIVVFADNGFSGLNIDRPDFRSLENDILRGTVRRIIVQDISRVARDYLLIEDWLDSVKAAGVEFISVRDNIVL